MTDPQIAWAAGLFEGEGCITWKTRRGKLYPYVYMSMTDKDVMEKFANLFGLTLRIRTRGEAHWKDQWRFETGAKHKVRELLSAMLPFFGERRAYKALNTLDLLDKI
jgi:hypothetical protein